MDDDIALLNVKVDAVNTIVVDMKLSLKELTTAITKLTLIEERQINANAALDRALKSIEKIDARVHTLEQLMPENKRTSIWLDRAAWGGMGLVVMLLIKKSGLM
jgi:hypothetical protein